VRKIASATVLGALLVGCNSDPVVTSPSASVAKIPPVSTGIGYYGEGLRIDSSGTPVPARLLFVLGADSSFKMYLAPKSSNLYHPTSSTDLFRINGKLVSWNSGISNSMTFSVDSTKSHWGESGKPMKNGSVVISGDDFKPNVKFVVLRAENEPGTGGLKMELQTSMTDSNQLNQAGLGI
jgi:hypothetical protein